MRWLRDRLRRWLIADDELSEMLAAGDIWLAQRESFRLDQADGVGLRDWSDDDGDSDEVHDAQCNEC